MEDVACYCNAPAATEYLNCVLDDTYCTVDQVEQFESWGQQQCSLVGVNFDIDTATSAAETRTAAPASASEVSGPIPTGFGAPASSPTPATTGPIVVVPASSGQSVPHQTTSPTSAPAPQGLSTGAKAGIGVGAGLGTLILLALIGLLVLFLRRRNKGQQQQQNPQQDTLPAPQGPPAASQPYPSQQYIPPYLAQTQAQMDKPPVGGVSDVSSPAAVSSDASNHAYSSSNTWTTYETKVASPHEHELFGSEPSPVPSPMEHGQGHEHEHDPSGGTDGHSNNGNNEPRGMVL